MKATNYVKLLSPQERQEIIDNPTMPADLREAAHQLLNAPTEEPRARAQKISSHAGWYHGKWERDTCACGNPMLVPIGKRGQYRCNECADRAEFGGY